MKLQELEATKIVKSIMGEREGLKEEGELAKVLKKRLTKKERQVINAKINNTPTSKLLEELNLDNKRYEELILSVTKKIKNESLHKDLYNKTSK